MSSNNTIGKSAQNVAFSFFAKFELKYTPTDIKRVMKNIKDLMKAGYTEEELLKIIDYAFDNQPPSGIYSFGYIISIKDKALNEIKVKEEKLKREEIAQQVRTQISKIQGLEKVSNADKLRNRKSKYENMDLFGGN